MCDSDLASALSNPNLHSGTRSRGTEKAGAKMGFEDGITHHPAASRTPYQVVHGTQMASRQSGGRLLRLSRVVTQRMCGEEVGPGQYADSGIWKVGVNHAHGSEITQQWGGQ